MIYQYTNLDMVCDVCEKHRGFICLNKRLTKKDIAAYIHEAHWRKYKNFLLCEECAEEMHIVDLDMKQIDKISNNKQNH